MFAYRIAINKRRDMEFKDNVYVYMKKKKKKNIYIYIYI